MDQNLKPEPEPQPDTISVFVNKRWNMIGTSHNCEILPSDLLIDGTLYHFNGSGYYESHEILESNKGYWIKCQNEGHIIFQLLNSLI